MPRYLPDHLRQRQTYSEDLRKRVIYQRYTLEKKIAEISLDLNISKRVVERILHLWRTTGEVTAPKKDDNKKIRIMAPQEMEVSFHALLLYLSDEAFPRQTLFQLARQFPDLYLDEMQKILQELYGVVVGISTLSQTLRELGLTRKKVPDIALVLCDC